MAPWQYSDESYKEYTRTSWNESAETYLAAMRLFEPYGFDLLARIDPKVRETALDIATGPGEPAMSIARMVGADGRVVGIDLSEKMVEVATRLARQRRISNVEFRAMDAEQMDFPPDTFDLATSRFGFQIFTNPETVAKETLRVLKPRGRIGVAIWSTADRATALHAVVGAMLEYAEPDESGYLPTPYELGGPAEMTNLLERTGFHDAIETRRSHTMAFRDEDDYINTLVKGTPIGHSIKEEDPPVQAKILARTRQNLRDWKTRKQIEIPCEAVVVTATK